MDDAPTVVTLAEFNLQMNTARAIVREEGVDPASEQSRLRDLVPLMPEAHRAAAMRLIERLPELSTPPPPPSPLMLEAMRIQAEAAGTRGSRDEVRSALEAARSKIWELADRAPKDEAAEIRGLTRTLDHLHDATGDPFWTFPEP